MFSEDVERHAKLDAETTAKLPDPPEQENPRDAPA